jgi:ElaB/YqjD/DUF883 family membrane-anchored ribosome-binding protein
MLKKISQFKLNFLVPALLLTIALPAFAQQPLHAKQLPAVPQPPTGLAVTSIKKISPQQAVGSGAQSMEKMMQQIKQMMSKSNNMLQHVQDPGGKKMMQGHQGMMMHGNKDWTNMIQGSDNIVKNMDQVIEQMHNLMNNEKMMNNPQLKQHLEKMKSNLSGVMESMNSFLNNAEDVQKIQEAKKSEKSS